jgi:high-affinity nickel-transport protein
MDQLLLVATGSLLLGMRHAADPDHILAVSTIVSRERSIRRATHIGAFWGLGHSFTVAILGGAIIAFRVVPSTRVGLGLEFAVALMLVLLGIVSLRNPEVVHHHHAGLRPFLVGVMHGLAGSAAVALMIVSTIDRVEWALASLVIFSAGTLAGMSIMTGALVLPSLLATRRHAQATRWLRVASGSLTMGFGFYLACRIAFVDGLLKSLTP